MKSDQPEKTALDTIETWDRLFGPLISDVYVSFTALEKDWDSDFWRRCFFRCLITMIEAEALVLAEMARAVDKKGYEVKVKRFQEVHRNNVGEFAEKSPKKWNNSKFSKEIYFAAAVSVLEDAAVQKKSLEFSIPALKLFTLFQIRNRIVHPKADTDLRISEGDLNVAKHYLQWHESRVHQRISRAFSGLQAISQNYPAISHSMK
jgi:hypothetical protein